MKSLTISRLRWLPVFTVLLLLAPVACKRPPSGDALAQGGPDAGRADRSGSSRDSEPVSDPFANAGRFADRDPAESDLTAGRDGDPWGEGRLETVYFDFDRSQLTEAATAALDRNQAFLAANPGLRVLIEGHCDERGSLEYNLALGDRRAHAAKRYLIDRGIDAKRLETVSYGEERPSDPGHDEAAWAKNRRADFHVK